MLVFIAWSWFLLLNYTVVLGRYTKALEVIKKLHKEQAQEIKTYKLKLENLQTLKDAAYKVAFLFPNSGKCEDKICKQSFIFSVSTLYYNDP